MMADAAASREYKLQELDTARAKKGSDEDGNVRITIKTHLFNVVELKHSCSPQISREIVSIW